MEDDNKTPSALGNLSLIIGVLALLFALSFYQKIPMVFLSLLLAVPGLLFSIVCLFNSKISRLPLVLGIPINLAAIFFTLTSIPTHGHVRVRARRISCVSNLKQIGLSLKQYAMDYNDCFPHQDGVGGLEQIRSNDYLTDYGVYTCPSTSTTNGSGTQPLSTTNCDYIYFGGFKEGNDPQINGFAETPLAMDIPGNHKEYLNVLFHDGHVMGYKCSAKNSKEAIDFLHKKFKYTPEHYKILKDKAIKADIARGLP